MALAWPYADPALAAYILHAAAASANFPYNPAALYNPAGAYYPHPAAAAAAAMGRFPPGQGGGPGPMRTSGNTGGGFNSPGSHPYGGGGGGGNLSPLAHLQSPVTPSSGTTTTSSSSNRIPFHYPNGNISIKQELLVKASSVVPVPMASNSPTTSSTSSDSGNCHTCVLPSEGSPFGSSLNHHHHHHHHHNHPNNSKSGSSSPTTGASRSPTQTTSNSQPTLFQPYKETTTKA
jgi:hypothetical protein